ncbi:ABC transporter permease [candidate division KSB1 bacterium]|nr:ABC transporter permease [candidate division KSB1 bacterium]
MKIPIMYNLRNLVARKVTTLLTVLGIGLVVFVFAAVLMLARGFRETLMSSGDPSNVIVLRKAATSEMSSSISRNQANILKTQPEVVVLDNGKPLVSGEVVVVNNLAKRSDGQTTNVTVRGVSQESLTLRSKVKIVEGRMLRAGTSEIITGKGAAEKFKGCGLGESVEMGNREWTVVGVFEAGGSSFESEIWGDVEQLMQAFRRPVFSTMTMKLKDPTQFASMKERIEKDPQLTVDVKREIDFYEEQSQNLGLFIQILGIFVTVVFSFGAMAGAVITMYSAVANRASEIGTLRALGFKRRNILASFMIECILISLIGGALGIFFASFLQFIDISTTNWQSFSEVVFGFNLSAGITIGSLIFSIVMGLIGGLAPAVSAARMQVVDALRSA